MTALTFFVVGDHIDQEGILPKVWKKKVRKNRKMRKCKNAKNAKKFLENENATKIAFL